MLKQYLIDLLRQNVSEADLQTLWKSSRSGYHIVGTNGQDSKPIAAAMSLSALLKAIRNLAQTLGDAGAVYGARADALILHRAGRVVEFQAAAGAGIARR